MEHSDSLKKLTEFLTANPKLIHSLTQNGYSINYAASIAKLLDNLNVAVFDSKLSSLPDIKKKEYEGGFKIWECELDGTRFVLDNSDLFGQLEGKNVLEIGCGSGLIGGLRRNCLCVWKT